MRHDPIEFGRKGLAARAAKERVTRLATRLAGRVESAAESRVVAALDEAFARFTATGSRSTRVDRPAEAAPAANPPRTVESNAASAWEPIRREIVADLSAQLQALDCHRERLARLLRDIAHDPPGQ